jgi:hypothetical protein
MLHALTSAVRFRPTLVLLLATFACGAPGGSDDGPTSDEDDAIDVEAGPEDGGRLGELARLVWAHLDPETRAASSASETDVNADRDGDGIADALEEALLRRYRPYYRFSRDGTSDEGNRPADPLTELELARLEPLKADGDGAGAPLCSGRPAASLFTCRPDASFTNAHRVGAYCLSIDEARYGGVSFDEAQARATGLVGHVVNDTLGGHPAYKIEYWQFFAFNNQDVTILGRGSFGDHQGDWTSVAVWFDRREHRLAEVEYLIHGDKIRFAIPKDAKAAPNAFVAVKGSNFTRTLGNFFDEKARPAYDDNQAEFWVDQHGFRHVVVYIERGGHEFWPGAWGHAEPASLGPFAIHLNGHNGRGANYLVPDVTDRPFNGGEVDRPLTAAARVVLQYDGHWGCTNAKDDLGFAPLRKSPVGPAMHCEWKWPNRGAAAGCEN